MPIQRNVFYDDHKNKLDIYYENGLSLTPVVVIVHGGAWIFGSKDEMTSNADFLHQKGYVAVSIDYSLSQLDQSFVQRMIIIALMAMLFFCYFIRSKTAKAILLFLTLFLVVYTVLQSLIHENRTSQHPDHVVDVANAIAWVYKNISNYNGDPSNIFLLGHSSGAHLVSLVTLNHRFLQRHVSLPPTIIKGVIAISGPYSYWRFSQSAVSYLLNHTVFNQKEMNADALQITDQSKPDYNDWAKTVDAWPIFFEHNVNPQHTPPFLLLTAGVDWSLLYHARDFADMLTRGGAHVQNIHFERTTHFSIRTAWGKENKDVGDIVLRFLSCIHE
jgi:acetyl esterase/lipase